MSNGALYARCSIAVRAALLTTCIAAAARAGEFVPGGPCTRGRVRVEDGVVVSDWGTQLRGGCWSIGSIFGREELTAMKMSGLNALHLYAEDTQSSEPPGWAAEPYVDKMVEWCRQESVYIVITFGQSHLSSYEKVPQFWRFYAPRYADMTHVVSEIKNEGCAATANCAENAMQMYRDCYKIIREEAPQTHVMFLSHSNLKGGISPLYTDVERLGPEVDWTNASIAFHGYGTTGAFQEQAATTLGADGYAMSCTEFPFNNAGDLARAYERAGISYFWFEACWPGGSRSLGSIGSYLKRLGISWQPDFGDWPQPHVEHPDIVSIAYRGGAAVSPAATTVDRFVTTNLPAGNILAAYDIRGRMIRFGAGNGLESAEAAKHAIAEMAAPPVRRWDVESKRQRRLAGQTNRASVDKELLPCMRGAEIGD
jgi:hypothetical protein